jgi:nucleolar MIF4G domain-containing protein 1
LLVFLLLVIIRRKMPLITQIQNRKEKRKQARVGKKRKHQPQEQEQTPAPIEKPARDSDEPSKRPKTKTNESLEKQEDSKKLKDVKKKTSSSGGGGGDDASSRGDRFGHPDVMAALQRDDDEIADLEAKLGLGKKKGKEKKKLHKEYAKLEGFGDDFGDFLDDLDDIILRVTKPSRDDDDDDEKDHESDDESEDQVDNDDEQDEEQVRNVKDSKRGKTNTKSKTEEDPYGRLDPDIAASIRRDDEEIADLEAKMGLKSKKAKSKLYKEYSKLEGFGDDFGDFLDDLDDVIVRVTRPKEGAKEHKKARVSDDDDDDDEQMEMDNGDDESDDDSEGEELVPMKEPFDQLDEDDSVLEELERLEGSSASDEDEMSDDDNNNDNSGNSEDDEEEEESDDDDKAEPDHDVQDTYQPSRGEDIYGNEVDASGSNGAKPKKYIPPHLRKKEEEKEEENDQDRQERLRIIQQLLNRSLNRLSEDTMIPIAQSVAQLYPSHPSMMVHEMIWKNTKTACVAPPMLMTGLIPVYVACLVGVHIQTGDTIQLGEYLLEMVVTELWKLLEAVRSDMANSASGEDGDDADPISDKKSKPICNMILILCYLYNYNIVHCSFLYGVIRNLIESFSELDIECLLLLLNHCGRALRSDDPSALKEIVLLVQRKKSQHSKAGSASRVDYMVTAIMDLKNNKRRKQDAVHSDKASKLRKLLGRIKSTAASSNSAKTPSESSLRISLDDILNAETKGRWWKVGASWIGNQYRFSDTGKGDNESAENEAKATESGKNSEQDDQLMRLASKYRMNTERKRAIFCIIMGGSDCEDAFEKLCRGDMLKNRSERDTIRVLMECCGNEKSYNKFYGHLASRLCEYQPQCQFSFQLAFWDIFKQFDSMGVRKAANLAKLLFHLVAVDHSLKLMSVVKVIDMSDDEIEENALIFLTVFFSSILEHFEDPSPLKALFMSPPQKNIDPSKDDEDEGNQASVLVFFLETLKKSPKNQKGSRFRKNFKATVKVLDTDGMEDMF